MKIVEIGDAKRRLFQLVDQAASGEDVVLTRGGRPVVRITRLEGQQRPITFGVLNGKLDVPEDFDAPLPDDVRGRFEGR